VDPALARRVEDILANVRSKPGEPVGILPVLLRLETVIGSVPPDSIPLIAQALGATDAQVSGVLSYYPDLHTTSQGRHVVRVCSGEACLANHGSRVLRAVQDQLHVDVGDTTTGGCWTLEKVYCVGNCGVSPTILIDDVIYGRVAPEQVPGLLERHTEGKS